VVEKVDGHTVVADVSIEGTATTTGANGGKDVVRNDGREAFASEDDYGESLDSFPHTRYALHPNASAQNAEAHTRSSRLPGSSSLQPDPGGSETNTFAVPPQPSRKIKRYPYDVCGQILTQSGDLGDTKRADIPREARGVDVHFVDEF